MKFRLLLHTLEGLFITEVYLKFRLLLHTLGGLFFIITNHISLQSLFEVPTLVTNTWRTLHYYYDSHFATKFIWSSNFCYIHSEDSSLLLWFTLCYEVYAKFRLLLHTLGGLFIITTIHTLLRSLFEVPTFVTYTRRTLHHYYYDFHFATEIIWRFKINVIPYPSTLDCKL